MNVIQAFLYIALSSPLAHAENNVQIIKAHLGASVKTINEAENDIEYLQENAEKCTRFASMIQEKMLEPISDNLRSFLPRLAAYNTNPRYACATAKSMDVISATISEFLARAIQPQSELMNMTGDEAMTKALSWDRTHPECKMEVAGDPKSTRELRTYFALKQKLVTLRASAMALKSLSNCR